MRLPALLLASLLGGCLVVPTAEHGLLSGRGAIDDADVTPLASAPTRRETVLLRFGEPSLRLAGDRLFVYPWSVARGYWLLAAAAPYGGGTILGGAIPARHLFIVEFDEHGRVLRAASAQLGLLQSLADGIDRFADTAIGTEALASSQPASAGTPRLTISFPGPPRPPACQLDEPPGRQLDISVEPQRQPETLSLGQRRAAFSVVTHLLLATRYPTQALRAYLHDRFGTCAGHPAGARGTSLRIEIEHLELSSPVRLTSWDARAEMTLNVTAMAPGTRPETARVQCDTRRRTLPGPDRADFETVLAECLDQLRTRIEATGIGDRFSAGCSGRIAASPVRHCNPQARAPHPEGNG